jgi:16S rRNA (guanine527-N7)-methyltransferase
MILTPAERIHRDLLQKWRTAMNLVGPGEVDPHFVDSIAAVSGLDATGRWADLGSGAGFPGISLAARHPEAHVLLVESRQKRATFLQRVLTDTGLCNAEVFHGRVEDLAPGFSGLISRAYKPPAEFLADAARLLAPGGRVVVLTADDLADHPGWVVQDATRYAVPDGYRVRTVWSRAVGTTGANRSGGVER